MDWLRGSLESPHSARATLERIDLDQETVFGFSARLSLNGLFHLHQRAEFVKGYDAPSILGLRL